MASKIPGDFEEPQIPEPKLPESFVRRYWPYFIGILGVVLVVAWFWRPLWEYVPPPCTDSRCHTIEALAVQAGADGKLTGHFRVLKSTKDAIVTDRFAGACLMVERSIFDFDPVASCNADIECQKGKAGGQLPGFGTPAAWEGLCHLPSHSCWIRPGGGAPQGSLCNKDLVNPRPENISVTANFLPFDPAQLNASGTSDYVLPAKRGTDAKIRVFACLNGVSPQDKRPCANNPGDKWTDWGDAAVFRVPVM